MTNAVHSKGGTIATFAVLALAVALAGLVYPKINGHPRLDDRESNNFTLVVIFTNSPRGAGEVTVISTLNGAPNFTDRPTTSPKSWPMYVPPGSTITLGAWQSTPGLLSCTIRKNGQTVSDLKTERVGGKDTGVHCQYTNPK